MEEVEFFDILDDLIHLYNRCQQHLNEKDYPGLSDDPLDPEEEAALAEMQEQSRRQVKERRENCPRRSLKIEICFDDIPCHIGKTDAARYIEASLKAKKNEIVESALSAWNKDRTTYINEMLDITEDYMGRSVEYFSEGKGKKSSYNELKSKLSRWNDCIKVLNLHGSGTSHKEIAIHMGWLSYEVTIPKKTDEDNRITRVTEYLKDAKALIRSVQNNTFPQI